MKGKASKAAPVEHPTVSEFAAANDCSRSAVYRAIELGHLEASDSKPRRVNGGEMPLTTVSWRKRLEPAVGELKRGLYGWGHEPVRLEVLCGNEVKTFAFDKNPSSVLAISRELRKIADAHHRRSP